MEVGSHWSPEGLRQMLGGNAYQNTTVNQITSSSLWGWPRVAPKSHDGGWCPSHGAGLGGILSWAAAGLWGPVWGLPQARVCVFVACQTTTVHRGHVD